MLPSALCACDPPRRSFLLLSLHHQRCGSKTKAREAFRAGLALRNGESGLPTAEEARLLTAWALLESKSGNMHTAVLLLRRASHVEREPSTVLSWRRFREYNRRHNPLARKRPPPPRPSAATEEELGDAEEWGI